MDNYQNFGLIVGRVLLAIGFGIGGAILSVILGILYFKIVGSYLSLFGTGMLIVIGGIIGMPVGVLVDYYGYKKGKRK